jgi:uncharacterized membrane protein (UPF0127 family)
MVNPSIKLILITVVIIALVLLSIFSSRDSSCNEIYRSDKVVILGSNRFKVQDASTEEQRGIGLGGRKCLGGDKGMLFTFNRPGTYGFWMKEMNFSIDIIWLDIDKKVVSVEKDVRPSSYPRIYYPSEPSLYVLEVKAGISDQDSIAIGQQLSW